MKEFEKVTEVQTKIMKYCLETINVLLGTRKINKIII